MRLVKKGFPHTGVRTLDPTEREALLRYCVKEVATGEGDEAVVKRLLAEMRDGAGPTLWMECDCRNKPYGGSAQPLITTRSVAGRVHLVRLNQYGGHECELENFRSDPDEDEAEVGVYQPMRPVGDALDYLDAVGGEPGEPRDVKGSPGAKSTAQRLPRMGRVLHTILHAAQFNVVDETGEGAAARVPPWEKVKAFAREERLSEQLALDQLLWTYPLTSASAIMQAVDRLTWPAKKRRMGFLLFLAEAVHGKTLTVRVVQQVHTVQLARVPRVAGRGQAFGDPPYWVLIKVDRDAQGQARFGEAFAQSAFEKLCPVPLDSAYERSTMSILRECMSLLKKRGCASRLVKPLFDFVEECSDTVYVCRPDFELGLKGGRIVIETMGQATDDYLERKAGTHQAMARRGRLLQHVVDEAAGQHERDAVFKSELMAALFELAKRA